MKLLIDTHIFLWVISGNKKLSKKVKGAFLDVNNDLYLSAASYWEICIKYSLDKIDLADNWAKVFDREMAANGISWLPIGKNHCRGVCDLPFIHRDPFDRMLVSQARSEGMTLLTADSNIRQYEVDVIH